MSKIRGVNGGDQSVYCGKGVLNVIQNVNDILGPKLVDVDVR